jgi:hypothetical protein
VLGSSQDCYLLEESTTSSTSGFTEINRTTAGDHTSPYSIPLTRTTGTYYYRARVVKASGYSNYSTVVQVTVTANTPTVLRIINDLYDQTNEYGNWSNLNTVIRVRIGSSQDGVINSTVGEKMYNGETTSKIENTKQISPKYNSTTSYCDFDVSGITTDASGKYYIYIQNGYWDAIYDVNTFVFLYYEKHYAQVINCQGQCCVPKWTTIIVSKPYGNPEVIRLKDFLPQTNWYGSIYCN